MRFGGRCLTLPKFQRTHSRTNFLFFYSNVRFQKSDPSIKTTARHSFESERTDLDAISLSIYFNLFFRYSSPLFKMKNQKTLTPKDYICSY